MTPPWMLLRIALETSRHHQSADDDRLVVLDASTPDAYRALLARIYGFEVAVEMALARVTDLEPGFLNDRLRAMHLQHDLRTLGMSREAIATLPQASSIAIRNASQALGWMFVLERHTLIAGQLRRQLLRTLGDRIDAACTYLHAYGDTPGAKFREFGAALCAYAHLHKPAAMVAAANEAFRAQRQWYLASGIDHAPRAVADCG